jgi:hypothetical protein
VVGGAVLAAVAAVAVVVVAGLFVLRSGDEPTPREHAVRSCAAADRFDKAVRRNADIDTVNRALDTALGEAQAAEKGNSLYVGLTSGLVSLRVAIDHNDAQAARIGIDVVRTECAYVHRG